MIRNRSRHFLRLTAAALTAAALTAGGLLGTPAALAAGSGPRPGADAERPATPWTSCRAPAPPADGSWVVDPASLVAGTGAASRATPREVRRVRAAVRNLVTCLNLSNDRAATLFSPHFVRDFMGQTDYREVPHVLGGLTMSQVRLGPVLSYAGGGWSMDADYLAYGHQVRHERTFFWPDPTTGTLLVNGLRALPARPLPGAVTVRVEAGEYFFRPVPARVCAPHGRVLVRLRNVGSERHEAIVFRLPPGATAADLIRGVVPWSAAETVAQDNGADALPLVDLAPGDYTFADFIAAPDGLPHVLHGQEARLTVLAPDHPTCRRPTTGASGAAPGWTA